MMELRISFNPRVVDRDVKQVKVEFIVMKLKAD